MTASAAWVVAAMLGQGAIALVLLGLLGRVRLPLVAAGKVHVSAIALSRDPWPDREKRVSNAFDNQFQLPVLFYAAAGLAMFFVPTPFEVLLAWAFVISRIAHAAIFVITNNVIHRFSAFTIGYAILVLFWIDVAVRLLLSSIR